MVPYCQVWTSEETMKKTTKRKARPVTTRVLTASITFEAYDMLEIMKETRRGCRSFAVEDAIRALYANEQRRKNRGPIKDAVHRI